MSARSVLMLPSPGTTFDMRMREMKEDSGFPPGWDEARVRRLLEHYESQTDVAGEGLPA